MRLLLILLSVMAWTVESKNAVSGDGTWPYDIEVSYTNTYQKGQVRAGDKAVLTLGHLEGITVEKVSLAMRANANAGAGLVSVTVNGQSLTSREVTYKEVSDAVVVFEGVQNGVQELEISVEGEQNSLYVDAFTIYWAAGPPHTVTLMKGSEVYDTMTEEQGGHGVVLPKLSDEEAWRFEGWCTWEFWEVKWDVKIHKGGQRYYPGSDCTLWAVYRYDNEPEMVYQKTLESGTYIYANSIAGKAISGVPENGKMGSSLTMKDDANQHYYITFNAAGDSATIQHKKTGTYIGYSGIKLDSKPSKWCVFHKDDKTAFYMQNKGKTYILWPSMLDDTAEYAGLYITEKIEQTPTVLIPVGDSTEPVEPVYTCHPESPQGLETVSGEGLELSGEWVIPFGIYKLIIKDGKKELRLKE